MGFLVGFSSYTYDMYHELQLVGFTLHTHDMNVMVQKNFSPSQYLELEIIGFSSHTYDIYHIFW